MTTAQCCRHLYRLADEKPAGPRRFLPSAMALEWPWSYRGQSTVESGGGVLKTGRVAGTLVTIFEMVPIYLPIFQQLTIVENESQPLSGRDSHNCWRKPSKKCTVSSVVGKFLTIDEKLWLRLALVYFMTQILILIENALAQNIERVIRTCSNYDNVRCRYLNFENNSESRTPRADSPVDSSALYAIISACTHKLCFTTQGLGLFHLGYRLLVV